MTSNIERIGDHAVNICDYTKLIEEKHIVFSDDAKQQMEEMKMICEKCSITFLRYQRIRRNGFRKFMILRTLSIRRQKNSTKVTWNVSTEENVMMKQASFL